MVAREGRPHKVVAWLCCCCGGSWYDIAAMQSSLASVNQRIDASHPNAGSSAPRWCGETEDAGALAEQEGWGGERGKGLTEHKWVRAYLEMGSKRISR